MRRVGPFVGLVTEQDITEAFLTHRERCVREARPILSMAWAEDAVSDVFTYLVTVRDELKAVPTRAYLLVAVRHRCYEMLRPLAYQRTLYVDPEDIVDLEEAREAQARGRPTTRDDLVRLPVSAGA